MSRRKAEPPRQLFTLFRDLEPHTQNQRDRSSLIGYAVLGSLIDFSTQTGSQEEQQWEEVKRVYNTLEQALVIARSQGAYEALCELQAKSVPRLERWLEYSHLEHLLRDPNSGLGQSTLLRIMIPHLQHSSRNYQDRLRRDGLALYTNVRSHGLIQGSRVALQYDYRAVYSTFGGNP